MILFIALLPAYVLAWHWLGWWGLALVAYVDSMSAGITAMQNILGKR